MCLKFFETTVTYNFKAAGEGCMKTKENKQISSQGNKSTKNIKKIGILIGLCLLFLALSGGVLYFADAGRIKEQFGRNVTVNRQSLYGLTAAQAAQKLDKDFQSHRLIIMENGESIYELSVGEAGYSLDTSALASTLDGIIKQQKPGFHPFKDPTDFSVTYPVNRADDTFAASFTTDKLSGERADSVNAYLNYDEEQKRFVIVPEIVGNKISDSALQELVRNFLDTQLNSSDIPKTLEINLDDTVYIKPEVTAEQEDIQNQMNTLNQEIERYRTTTVTYLFGDTKEVINGDLICSWMIVDNENNSVQLSEDAVREYISQLASTYNTMYRDRNFTTTGGATVKLEHNEYGYLIDQEAEYQQLITELGSGEAIEREPVYSKSGYKRNGKDDLVGCYIEVSIDQQHLWLYKDGALVTETDIVSGKPTKETATYKGAWPIAYKASPYTLSSDIYGYAVSVTYWMPFVYGQGLHDMNRSSFGGEIYKSNGSHGCVNLPKDQAKLIYETIEKGYPIILY